LTSASRPCRRRGPGRLGTWLERILIVSLCYGLFWALVVYAPFVRLAWSFATDSGSTPLDGLLPADPIFRLSVARQDDVVGGVGETSLPDGSQVQMWIEYWGDGADPRSDFGSTMATVENGRFHAEFSVAGWPAGEVVVNALAQVGDGQPPAIAARYGPTWSRMFGPQVKTDEDTGDLALEDFQGVSWQP
jgi:hypothetical protein